MFSPPNDHVHILDPVTSRDDDQYSLDSWEPLSFATNNASQNYRGIQFRPDDDHQSGVSSPPLWRNSSPDRPRHHHHHHRVMSPSSRAEAIARGQWELMEMVKNMPESCYELSLKDLVEQQPAGRVVLESQEESFISSTQQAVKRQESSNKKKKNNNEKKTGKISRSGSMDNRGMFLKMIFPISLGGSNKKKKSKSSGKTLAKVSPKPEGSEKEWWKKKRSWGSRESDSSTNSSSKNSTKTNRSKGFLTSCWSSFHFRKSKSAE